MAWQAEMALYAVTNAHGGVAIVEARSSSHALNLVKRELIDAMEFEAERVTEGQARELEQARDRDPRTGRPGLPIERLGARRP